MTHSKAGPPGAGGVAIARELFAAMKRDFELARPGGIVIGIAGESGSGKSATATTLARELCAAGIATLVLHQDDYFLRPPRSNHEYRSLDLARVGPHEVNLGLLASHLAAFRKRHTDVVAPVVDYGTDRFLTRHVDFSAHTALVVEGTYALMLDDIDVAVFLEATHHDTRERRRARNRDIDAPVIDDILEVEHRIIAPQSARSHYLIDRHFVLRSAR